MFGTIMAIGIVVLLNVYLIGRARDKKADRPIVELRADERIMHRLGLRPGERVELRNSGQVKEVHVYGGPNADSRLGTLTQNFIYNKVLHHAIKARIHSIKGSTLKLELDNA